MKHLPPFGTLVRLVPLVRLVTLVPLVPLVLVLILLSCTGDLKQYQKPENSVMSPVEVPMYEGITDIMRDNSFKTLMPGTQVYLTGDSAVGQNIPYVKVTWNDSSAYVRANMLIHHGRMAVVNAVNNDELVAIYNNPTLDVAVSQMDNDWDLTVVGDATGIASTVLYLNEQGEPVIGYVPTESVSDDAQSIAFFNEYSDAVIPYRNGNEEPLKAVVYGQDFASSKVFKWRQSTAAVLFDDSGDENFNNEDYGDPGPPYNNEGVERFETEYNWTTDGGVPLKESEFPGTIKKYIVFTDSTEIEGDGHYIGQGYAWPSPGFDKDVQSVRFELIPNQNCDVVMSFESWDGFGEYPDNAEEKTLSAEAGKPVVLVLGEACESMRVEFRVGNALAALAMHVECGD